MESRFGASVFAKLGRRFGRASFGNHARAGTGLDQRQRRGMDYGLESRVVLWRGESRPGPARHGRSRFITTIVVGTASASRPSGGIQGGQHGR